MAMRARPALATLVWKPHPPPRAASLLAQKRETGGLGEQRSQGPHGGFSTSLFVAGGVHHGPGLGACSW